MIPLDRRRLQPEGPALAILLLLSIVAGGTIGYVILEGWGLWDAFYMTVITVTTVGYREIHPLSRVGEAFTVLVLIGGVGAALYTFTLLATVVVEGGLQKRFRVRRRARARDAARAHRSGPGRQGPAGRRR